jgi:formate hydrogenlyase transcriptional activator
MNLAEPRERVSANDYHGELLDLSRVIASHRTVGDLLQDLGHRLHSLVEFRYFSVLLYDGARNVMRLLDVFGADPSITPGMEFSLADSPSALALETQKPVVIVDLAQESRFARPLEALRSRGLRSLCCVPLSTPRQRLGTFCFGSHQVDAYGKADLLVLSLIAGQAALAIEGVLNFEKVEKLRRLVIAERDRLKLLLEVNNAVVSHLALPELIRSIPSSVRQAMRCDATCLSLPDRDGGFLRIVGLDYPDGRGFMHEEMTLPIDGSSPGTAFRSGKPYLWGTPPTHLATVVLQGNATEGFQSGCFLPIICRGRGLGVLHLLDRAADAFKPSDVDFLVQVANQVALALGNALEYGKVSDSREQLAEERSYLRNEIRAEHGFAEIVGESKALSRVLHQVEVVAPTNSTVLIRGETGSGKELVARAIHNLSSRRDHIFVKLNCAAIPLGLLESELFGHEKGAFTGAIARKIGRFELANQGTLFLDEIGDIPLELQPKLLRVLQEQEFERLGSTRPIRVNVRLIAATHRNLAKMIEANQFRADLFYRLNVFPVVVPPLRERTEDIPALATRFVEKYSGEMNKRVRHIPDTVLRALMEYDWPGNVRELQNFIERAVILSPGEVLMAPLAELRSSGVVSRPPVETAGMSPIPASTGLKEMEREHILATLRETGWVLGGQKGAAVRLGLPRTTLLYKMRRLGISRDGEGA